jgi:hypothetical protein
MMNDVGVEKKRKFPSSIEEGTGYKKPRSVFYNQGW